MTFTRLIPTAALLFAAATAQAQIALTGAPVQQDFDTLVNTGTGTSAQVPAGWAFLESTGNTSYTAADGTATSGDTYSAGSGAASDRAFATIASNSNQPTIGAQFSNQTGANIGELTIAFSGEQWRSGGSGNVDRLNFAISTDASSLGDGTWTEVDALDLVAPIQGAMVQVLDGNLPANQVSVSHTITGLAIGNGQSFWIRWVDPNGIGADDMLGIDNVVVSTTGGVDLPPTVTSTTPANNATNVAPSANITIQFSEAVTTNPGWIALNCTVNGDVAAVVSGTGSSRTLDPVPTLAFGETCTGTVVAANVIDQDGTPDAMAANFVFAFTVVPDNAPTVASTTPANNASNVPVSSNIVISFSEPVSVGGSWYAISCANTGAHPTVVSGGPQTYTLNPDANFDLLELCTVTLTGALILDQDGTPDPLASNYVWTFTSAASAANYYNGVDSSSAAALRSTLHALIDDHTAYRYSVGTNNCNLSAPSTAECDVWDIVEAAEQDPGDPTKVLDVYRNRKYTKIADRSGNTGPTTYNREHTWPNSLGFNDLSGVDANNNPYSPYVDGHMLYASASDHNQSRGNKPYDNCSLTSTCAGTENVTDANYGFGGGSGAYPGNSNWALGSDGNTGSYEVWNHRKGDMARAILYMDIRYEGGNHANGQPEPDLIVTNNRALVQNTPSGQVPAVGYMAVLDTLLAWHQADPPDAGEILRNEIVYGFQGNRNPFIDHPEYAACLFQNACTAGEDIFDNGFE